MLAHGPGVAEGGGEGVFGFEDVVAELRVLEGPLELLVETLPGAEIGIEGKVVGHVHAFVVEEGSGQRRGGFSLDAAPDGLEVSVGIGFGEGD